MAAGRDWRRAEGRDLKRREGGSEEARKPREEAGAGGGGGDHECRAAQAQKRSRRGYTARPRSRCGEAGDEFADHFVITPIVKSAPRWPLSLPSAVARFC